MTDSPPKEPTNTQSPEDQAVGLMVQIYQILGQEQKDGKLHILCTSPEAKELTRRQKAALHLCKHEVFSAFFRLFEHVPPGVVAKITDQAIKDASASRIAS